MKSILIGCALGIAAQLSLSSWALAAADPSCKLFSKSDMQGESLDLLSQDSGGSAATIVQPWVDELGSLWLRDGYVLETYDQSQFDGKLTTWDASLIRPQFHTAVGGSYVNVSELGSGAKIGSYRCRVAGTLMSRPGLSPFSTLHAYNNIRFDWRSAGNHPNHKWVELNEIDGRRTILVHKDDTYGINATDFVLDVDSGLMSMKERRSANVHLSEDLTLPTYESSVIFRLAYAGGLWEMLDIVQSVAQKNDIGFFLFPPKPELHEVENFLRQVLSRVQR